MSLACKLVGIIDLIPCIVFVTLFLICFQKKLAKLPVTDDVESEKQRGRFFYRNIFIFFLIVLDFEIISVSAFVLNITFGEKIPFYASPVIVLCILAFAFTVIFHIGFGKFAVKYQIKNYNPFTHKLTPVSVLGDKGLLGLGLFIGVGLAEIVACAVYMVMLLV